MAPTTLAPGQFGRLVLVADPQEDAAIALSRAQHAGELAALLDRRHQAVESRHALVRLRADQVARAADEQRVVAGRRLEERAADRLDEALFGRRERSGSEKARADHPRSQRNAAESLVEETVGPAHEAGVDLAVEVELPLGDVAGVGDHDHDDAGRGERDQFDAQDLLAGERRRADQRHQLVDLGERLGGLADRVGDLVAVEAQLDLRRLGPTLGGEQSVDEVAVAGLGRTAARGGVRLLEQAVADQHRELVAHGRGGPGHVGTIGDRPRTDRRAGGRELLDDDPKDLFLSVGQHRNRA